MSTPKLTGRSLQEWSRQELEAAFQGLMITNAALMGENATLLGEITQLKSSLSSCLAHRDEMRKEIEALSANALSIAALQAQIRQLEEQNRILKEENTALKKTLEGMQETIHSLQSAGEEQDKKIAQQAQRIDALEEKESRLLTRHLMVILEQLVVLDAFNGDLKKAKKSRVLSIGGLPPNVPQHVLTEDCVKLLRNIKEQADGLAHRKDIPMMSKDEVIALLVTESDDAEDEAMKKELVRVMFELHYKHQIPFGQEPLYDKKPAAAAATAQRNSSK